MRTQHQRGRVLTDRLLAATTEAAATGQPARDALVQNMSAFIRMYEPHEAVADIEKSLGIYDLSQFTP